MKTKTYRRWVVIGGVVLAGILAFFLLFVNVLLEPMLRKKLHTIIIQGSDSLYTYSLGRLNANFLGGNVTVENLEINVDSSHYHKLQQRDALPALTIELTLKRGHVKGVGILPLLFGKKINIHEIYTGDANIRLLRHLHNKEEAPATRREPLWKAMQPAVTSIGINRIKLDGVKLLYKNSDTSEAMKLQFDRFDALLKDIRVDSASYIDSTRVGFAKSVFLKFHDLKFRTADSSYKMKAEWITYSSQDHSIQVDGFKLQPTMEKVDYYKAYPVQDALYYVEFDRVRFANVNLVAFIRKNIVSADSILMDHPILTVYQDGTQERIVESKIGKYPHQKLLKAGATVQIKNIAMRNGVITYTQKNALRGEEGTLRLANVNLAVNNATNDPRWISANHLCTAHVSGTILQKSPIQGVFRFYLDSTNGRFDFDGSIRNVTAAQINPLATSLSNVVVPSVAIRQLNFQVKGEDFTATSNVQMLYNNLVLSFRKTDKETGETTTRKFITKLVNRYAIRTSNPGTDGIERKATNATIHRLTTQGFFGVIWKSVFNGMQDIMMK